MVELRNLRELITSKPLLGWGEDVGKVEAVIRDDPEVLLLWREEMKPGQGARTDIVDNINDVGASDGTSRSYTLARLKRARPDLFAKVVAGEMTAHGAAVEAGFRKRAIRADARTKTSHTMLQV